MHPHERAPTASIIIPCRDAERWLPETLSSCFSQGGTSVEIVVVDDGSTDRTRELLQKVGSKVRLLETPRMGACVARNAGLRAAAGRYVKFLDADDILEPGVIDRQVRALDETRSDICYGDWGNLFSDLAGGNKVGPSKVAYTAEHPIDALLSDWWCPPFAYLLRRATLKKTGVLWDERLSSAQDFDFILTAALHEFSFVYRPGLTGLYRQHSGPRVSRRPPVAWVSDRALVLSKAVRWLQESKQLTNARRGHIARYYLMLAKRVYGSDLEVFDSMIAELKRVDPEFAPRGPVYRSLVWLLGYRRTEALLEVRRRHRRRRQQPAYRG